MQWNILVISYKQLYKYNYNHQMLSSQPTNPNSQYLFPNQNQRPRRSSTPDSNSNNNKPDRNSRGSRVSQNNQDSQIELNRAGGGPEYAQSSQILGASNRSRIIQHITPVNQSKSKLKSTPLSFISNLLTLLIGFIKSVIIAVYQLCYQFLLFLYSGYKKLRLHNELFIYLFLIFFIFIMLAYPLSRYILESIFYWFCRVRRELGIPTPVQWGYGGQGQGGHSAQGQLREEFKWGINFEENWKQIWNGSDAWGDQGVY